ncbi:MAG: hypothetical protein AAB617_00165 [Patescibacteria group bacterium]
MPHIAELKRDREGHLVVKDSEYSLADIIALVQNEFQITSFDDIYFPQPNHEHEWDELVIAKIQPQRFYRTTRTPGESTVTLASLFAKITLRQVILQVESLLNSDFNKVRLLRDNQGLHIQIDA